MENKGKAEEKKVEEVEEQVKAESKKVSAEGPGKKSAQEPTGPSGKMHFYGEFNKEDPTFFNGLDKGQDLFKPQKVDPKLIAQ
jgi:hypothetical protein